MKQEYFTVKIPDDLARRISQVIDRGIQGYRTRAEFVNDAIRRRLDEMEKEKV